MHMIRLLVRTMLLTGILFTMALANTKTKNEASATSVSSSSPPPLLSSCKCVIFRFDDVQGWWEHDIQKTVLSTYIHMHTKVTPAVVMVKYGNDTGVVETVKAGQRTGLFEVALHGWHHDNFSAKTLDEQTSDMAKANAKLERLNGVRSNIFVAPYDAVNNDTLKAMQANNLTVLSADANQLPSVFPQIDNETGIANVPFTVNFIDQNRPLQANGKTSQQILEEIRASIDTNGYAVLLSHPQDFALIDASGSETMILPQINNTQLDTLKAVIAQLRESNIHVASFNELTGLSYPPAKEPTSTDKSEQPQQQVATVPELDSGVVIAGVALCAVVVIGILGARTQRNKSPPAPPSKG